jgi:hypothetical protein
MLFLSDRRLGISVEFRNSINVTFGQHRLEQIYAKVRDKLPVLRDARGSSVRA